MPTIPKLPRGGDGPGAPWVPVTQGEPCPICDKPDRCKLAPNGDRVMCFRVESEEPTAGNAAWFHAHPYALTTDRPRAEPKPRFRAAPDFGKLAAQWSTQLTPARAEALADALMLPAEAFATLPLIGWNTDPGGDHWTFPEVDAAGTIVGITRRYQDGAKKQVAGGKRGLTIPTGLADHSGPVYVCEGASDVLALTHARLCAVGRPNNSGGAALLTALIGTLPAEREIVVLGENDLKPDGQWPGRDGMRSVAAALRQSLPTRTVRAALPPTDAKDARGWLTDRRRGATTWPERGALFVTSLVPDDSTPPPTSADADRAWPEPIDDAAFIGPLGEYARLAAPDTEADPAAILLQMLVLFGNVIGRGAFVAAGPDRHHGNEFLVVVGDTSGGRKGTSLGVAKAAFDGVDDAWLGGRVLSGLSSGEGLIHAVRDPVEEQQAVKEKNRTVGYETVITDHGVEDKRLVAVEPEFVGVLKQAERSGNTLSVVVRQGWESGNLRTLTKHSPTKATGAHVSLIGHITETELKRYLGEVETANGFGNRFLWVVSRRARLLPEPPRPDPSKTAAVRARILSAVAFAKSMGPIERDAEAREAWGACYGELSCDRPGLAGALTARAGPHVLRLALIYALSEQSPFVAARHLLAALAVWDYCERSVNYLFGDAIGDGVADDALALIRRCPAGVTRTDLMNYFARNVSSARLTVALGKLLSLGQVRREERSDTGGRPAEVYFAARGGR